MQTETLAQPASKFPELDDLAFIARFDAAVTAEQAKFDAWLAEDKFEALIAGAKGEAMVAYKEAASLPEDEVNAERSTWIEIDFKHRRAEPLIQALDNAGIGFAEIQTWSWWINVDHVLGKRRRCQTRAQADKVVEAFAMALSRPGFELKITRE